MSFRVAPLIVLLLAPAGCADRQTGGEDDSRVAGCVVVGGHARYADGTMEYLYDEDGETASVCSCMEPEEAVDTEVKDAMRTAAYDRCLELATLYPDAVDTTCEQNFGPEEGIAAILIATLDNENAHWLTPGLPCMDDGVGERGCSVRPRPGVREVWCLFALMLVVAAGGRRRVGPAA